MSNNIIGFMSLGMLLFYLINYRKLNGKEIGFPLYIYFAMFPFKLRALPLLSYDDLLLKSILIFGLFLFVVKNNKLKINIYEVLFLVSVIMSDLLALYSNSEQTTLMLTGLFNIIFIFSFTIYFKSKVGKWEGMYLIFKILIINATVLSVMALIEILIYLELRAAVSMNNPNYLGFYLTIAFCITMYLTKKISIKSVILLILLGLGIISTGSFSAILGMVLCMILISFYYFINKSLYKYFTYIFFISFFVIAVYYIILGSSDIALTNPLVGKILEQKDNIRLYVWGYAIELWKNNIVFGIGYNNFFYVVNNYSYVTHNDALRLIVETGIIGTFVMICYVIGLIIKIVRCRKNELILFVSILSSIFIFSMFHNNMNSLLFWTMLSLPLYKSIIEQQYDDKFKTR
ncbi:hypothetical protein BFRIG_03674 [Peribacillus frigoritolerans]|uniref:O-antigen ligase family protein n=1 Tax=Peribacillus frigoritolerans TaxID=450367 RepID=UPI0030D1688C